MISSRFKEIGRKVGIATLCVGSGAGLGYGAINRDEGTKRSLQFWSQIFPIYLHYRTYQLLNRDLGILGDKEAEVYYEYLHNKYANRVRDIVYGMRGFYLKNAQLLSTQDDFVPKEYMRWVKDTQDNVPSDFKGSEAKEYVKKMMKVENNLDFDDIFTDWDDKPLGVASIGQVHRAVLRSSGKEVAVKLLCPGIERRFRSDIRTLRSFCRLAMPQHVTAFDEIEKQFCTEFDYREEANNLTKIREVVMPKWHREVNIPAPYHALCSKHILVMEYLDGIKLVDGIRKNLSRLAELQGNTLEDMEKEMKEKIRLGTMKFQTIEEKRQSDERIRYMITINDVIQYNTIRFAYNWSVLRLVYGPWEYHWTEQPMDLGAYLETLCNVHGYELFTCGAFNGDCHPGNILLLKDGRLGLIDYGQVKTMSVEHRIVYAKLIIAHARGDKKEIIRLHFDEVKAMTKYKNPEIGYLLSCFYNDRDTEDVTQGMNISTFVDWAQSKDPVIQLPEEFIFASRMNFLLRGMGKAFGIRLRMSLLWEKEAKEFLKSQQVNY